MDLFAKRISKSMWCLLGIILFIILFSLISPYLAPNDPYLTHSDNILAAPDMNHLFGTDNHGRDVLSRVMVGSRSSIFAAFAIIACAGLWEVLWVLWAVISAGRWMPVLCG